MVSIPQSETDVMFGRKKFVEVAPAGAPPMLDARAKHRNTRKNNQRFLTLFIV
jgi:hypothetical protein